MRKFFLFQIFDNIGMTAISDLVPANNTLTAAMRFKKSFIDQKDPLKNPYQYKALDLVLVACCEEDENGVVQKIDTSCRKEFKGVDIPKIISDEMAARGVDDYVMDTEENN